MQTKTFLDDFPVLNQSIDGNRLVYLDNGATTQKPWSVINRMQQFISKEYATVHRGVYFLSQQATEFCEEVRRNVQHLINAPTAEEIIFVKGTTDAINLVAQSFGSLIPEGKEILITAMEHHANIVPWQMLCEKRNITLKVAAIRDNGELDLDDFKSKLSSKTALVSMVHISNVLGTINPVKEMIALAKTVGAKTLVDGAQAIGHHQVDVQALGCDFYCFSAHKMYGPTGIGVLYGNAELLEKMPPYQGGGDMILSVSFEKTIYAKPPLKFEAGTPAICEIIGLGAAIEYLQTLTYRKINQIETDLFEYAQEKLNTVSGLTHIGTAAHKAPIHSFILDGVHPHDVGTILDQKGVAVRVGHHCAQPIMKRFNTPATVRASYSFYNTKEDVDALVDALQSVKEIFG